MKQSYTESNWAVLAGLRFALASIVLISHLHWFAPLPNLLWGVLALGGKAAVLGFLLVSGLSIGHSYVHNPNGYLRRRFLRIYPLYFFAVLGTVVLTVLVGSPYYLPGLDLISAGWKTNFANMFFLQGFLSITIPYNGPLWSLGIEIVTGLIIVSLAVFLFCPYNWLFGFLALRYSWPWLIGFVLATQQRTWLVGVLLVLGVAVTAINKSDTGESLSWLTFGLVASIVLFLNAYHLSFSKSLQGVLNFFGEISYPLYLYHFPLYLLLYRYLAVREAWVFILFTFLLTIVLNYVLDHWLKRIFWKPLVNLLSDKLQRI
jgi:peptidoglycan/LPS O-acetylase OafA/YrhL